jgi:hypothetical protein
MAPISTIREPAAPVVLLLALCALTSGARADGHAELQTDALLGARPYEGLLVLRGGYGNASWVDADALVFMGATEDGREGDVLIVSVRLREPHGLGEARVGRFILSTGAVRPVQIDGVSTLARAPTGSTLELFGGLPVVPELGPRAFDWLAGARAGQWLFGQRLGAGVSYLQRRDAGQLANEEVGVDASATPAAWLMLSAVGAYDLVSEGISEVRVDALAHGDGEHLELFASRRVASRLLSATSLFSVLGATPSSELGSDALWNAFPRLDLGATLALELLDDHAGYRAAVRGTLRFADTSDGGDLRLEGQRRALRDEGFTSVLVSSEWPITRTLSAHATVELVFADDPISRGSLWPWARAGVSYRFGSHFTLAAAIAARATPELAHELNALARLGYRTELWQ